MDVSWIWLPIAIVVAVAMEFWAAFLHGTFWHGVLWFAHRSHHRDDYDASSAVKWETNDVFSFIHVPFAIALIVYGCEARAGLWPTLAFGVGVGMSLFGVGYFMIHDGMVHGRLPLKFLLRFKYFERVQRAHAFHHQRGGAPYGLFLGPWLPRRTAKHFSEH